MVSKILSVIASLLIFTAPSISRSAACIDGTNCFCDRIAGDANVVWCEDWEAQTLYETLSPGSHTNAASQNIYGSWYDSTGGFTGGGQVEWGKNSYWTHKFFPTDIASQQCNVQADKPSPAISPSGQCWHNLGYCHSANWTVGDVWGAGVNANACLMIQRAGDATAEVPTLTDVGIHDGRQIFAERIGAKGTGIDGKTGVITWSCGGGVCDTISVAYAMAYSSNFNSSGIWDLTGDPGNGPLKHMECGVNGLQDGWPLFNTGPGTRAQNPFRGFKFMKASNQNSLAGCQAATAGISQNVGHATCNGNGSTATTGVQFYPDTAQYSQTTSWPQGTWGCVQAEIDGQNTSNGRYRVWFNTALIIDIDHVDWTQYQEPYFNECAFNSHSNVNEAGNGQAGSNVTVFRYYDNMVFRHGAPVSCTDLGFSISGQPTLPTKLNGDVNGKGQILLHLSHLIRLTGFGVPAGV